MDLKELVDQVKSRVKNFFSFMNPITWAGVLAFAFGFWVGSGGEWEGTLFFSIFWMVGIWILTQFSNMRK